MYYDVKALVPYFDMINLWTVDFRTPKRSPQQADLSAPLYYIYDRNPQQNVDAVVRWWIEQGADGKFIITTIITANNKLFSIYIADKTILTALSRNNCHYLNI